MKNTIARQPKPTILDLEKKIAVLEADIRNFEEGDTRRRTILCELLGSYVKKEPTYTYDSGPKVDVLGWMGIAFLIGKLKADANFSQLIESRNNLRRENDDLREELYKLKNPENVK